MATVWEGYDVVLARSVAVKMLHPHLAADRLFLERFRREAVSAARLAHPNVVATFDAGITPEGTAFIVMELVRGATLSAFAIEHRPLPILVCVEIGKQIADALATAHRAGLVHRDIKPANILVCDTETEGVLVKVTDFGIAKAAEGLGLELTQTGMVMGTPRYLSPEQVEGREPDSRADLYALGVVLFELVAGEPPFRGPTEMAVAVQHLNDTPARLADLRPGVPPALDHLVNALLAKRPDDRPPSATAVRQALARIESAGRRVPSSATTAGPNSALVSEANVAPPPLAAYPPVVTPPRLGTGPAVGSPARGPIHDVPRTAANAPPNGRATQSPTAGPSGVGASWAQPPNPTGRTAPPLPRPKPARRPNWAGRFVALLVLVALVVVVVVLSNHGSSRQPEGAATPPARVITPIPIQNISVFHLERDADHADTVGYADDGNPDTAWETDRYFTADFGGLRQGLGLAMTLASSEDLHSLTVLSSTAGWSAQVYVADAVADPPALGPWGPPVASLVDINTATTTFSLRGHSGSAILLWITNLGPTFQTSIAEVTVR